MPAGSQSRPRTLLTPRPRDGLIALAALAALLGMLLYAWLVAGVWGFPLDDGWIYQTYARNLAQTGQWAFVPGVPSTGSTSIWWTLLIWPGYLLHLPPLLWTFFVGWLSLAGAGWAAARLVDGEQPVMALAAGLAVVLAWQMVWAAGSGMETAFFTAAVLWFFVWLRRHPPEETDYRWQNGLGLGLWGGGLMLARPEGVLAPAIAAAVAALAGGRRQLGRRMGWALAGGVGFGLVLGSFFAFNWQVSGTIWPNTFYAKQTEYAALWQQPYALRFGQQALIALIGGQVLLAPAVLWAAWMALREKRWLEVAPVLWMVAHWGLYAARLPVVYQHGRYAIPTIPVLIVIGVGGLQSLIRPRDRRLPVRLLSRAWPLTTALLFGLVLVLQGVPAYGRDVAFIDDEMVATAHWLADHTPSDARIAAHDIGALGYFAPHPLVDLAGLVSPEVVPVMHDAAGLADLVVDSGADYLVVFPGWNAAYADLVASPRFVPVWSAAVQPDYRKLSPIGPLTVYRVER